MKNIIAPKLAKSRVIAVMAFAIFPLVRIVSLILVFILVFIISFIDSSAIGHLAL